MAIININDDYGDAIKFKSVEAMTEYVHMCGRDMGNGLVENIDYQTIPDDRWDEWLGDGRAWWSVAPAYKSLTEMERRELQWAESDNLYITEPLLPFILSEIEDAMDPEDDFDKIPRWCQAVPEIKALMKRMQLTADAVSTLSDHYRECSRERLIMGFGVTAAYSVFPENDTRPLVLVTLGAVRWGIVREGLSVSADRPLTTSELQDIVHRRIQWPLRCAMCPERSTCQTASLVDGPPSCWSATIGEVTP